MNEVREITLAEAIEMGKKDLALDMWKRHEKRFCDYERTQESLYKDAVVKIEKQKFLIEILTDALIECRRKAQK